MHMLLVIIGGIAQLAVFALFGKLWGGDISGVAIAAKVFLPVWLAIAVVNLTVGVMRAGYTIYQELPILAAVFAVPAMIAAIMAWPLAKG
ncbi:hypothetical protein AB6806_21200 [Bosea sp. RCC_152_1]|uniref:hypothetical protein n=1 Tax=Bosea sp. RCC_152_1 TaxID=3239228 RepID=UPI0035250422